MSVAPVAATITEGRTLRLTRSAYDEDGRPALPSEIVWLSSGEKVATIGSGAMVTGHQAGSAKIVARWRGYRASSTVIVESGDKVVPEPPCPGDSKSAAAPSLKKACLEP